MLQFQHPSVASLTHTASVTHPFSMSKQNKIKLSKVHMNKDGNGDQLL
jgi:hypothetical protein